MHTIEADKYIYVPPLVSQINWVDVSNKSQQQVIEELERYPDHLNITVIRPPQLPPGLEDSLFRYFSRRFTKYNLVMTASTQLVNDHHLDQQHMTQGCAHLRAHENAMC